MEAQNTIINDIIADARAKKASDIHISEGMPIWYRVNRKTSSGRVEDDAGGSQTDAGADDGSVAQRTV